VGGSNVQGPFSTIRVEYVSVAGYLCSTTGVKNQGIRAWHNRYKFVVRIKTILQCCSRELLVEWSSKHTMIGGGNVRCLSEICVKHILISEYVGISRIIDCGVGV
jgi:hypothetical protein